MSGGGGGPGAGTDGRSGDGDPGGRRPAATPDGAPRPRVLHLLTRLQRGGSEAKTLAQIEALEGYRFVVGHGPQAPDPGALDRVRAAGAEAHEFSRLRHRAPLSNLAAIAQVRRWLRRRPVDLVHTHQTEAGIVGRFAADFAGGPRVIHTVHGTPFTGDRSAAVKAVLLAAERAAARRCDRIAVNAAALRDEYLARGIGRPGDYAVVPSGVEIERFADARPADDLAGRPGPVAVFAGRLVEGKGLGDLLAALEAVAEGAAEEAAAEEGAGLSLLVAGEGPLGEALAAGARRRGLEGRIRLLGHREDLPRVLAAADLFVLPSWREGTPRVVTEAMAAGLPVVATRVGGVPDQVRDGEEGRLIEPGDHGALAAALAELAADPELRARMGRSARERAGRWSIEAMAERTDALYRSVLEGEGRP